MNKRILFTIAGFILLGFLIQPAYAILMFRGSSVQVTRSSLPFPELEVAVVDDYLVLVNHSDKTHIVFTNNKEISLAPGDKIKWTLPSVIGRIGAEEYFIEQEGDKKAHIAYLLKAANVSEIKFRDTPFQIKGTIDNQPFQITGVIISPDYPTPISAFLWSIFAYYVRFGLPISWLVGIGLIIFGFYQRRMHKSAKKYFIFGFVSLLVSALASCVKYFFSNFYG